MSFDDAAMLTLAEKVASRYVRKGVRWMSHEEMTSVAALAITEARRTFEPAVCIPWGAYAWRAGVLAVCRAIRNAGPVRVSASLSMSNVQLARATVEVDDTLYDDKPLPDHVLISKEWNERVGTVMNDYLAETRDQMNAEFARAVLLHDMTPAEVAKLHGVPVIRVYRAVLGVRARMEQSLELYELWKERFGR